MRPMPQLEIVELPVSELVEYKNNAKIHDSQQVEQIANSISEFGNCDPIGCWHNEDGEPEIVEGHGRLMALRKLGIETAPVIFLDHLTDEQRRAYALVHNKLTMNSDFDFEILADELGALVSFDMTEFGFDASELNFEIVEDQEIAEDDVPDVAPSIVKSGDVWQLGRHRLMCGDSTDPAVVDRLMDGVKADMVFTDPPYGMKKESEGVLNDNLNFDDLLDFNRQWIPLTFGALKDNGSWYCWGIDEPLMDIYSNILKPMIKDNKITFRNLITWFKNPSGLGDGQNNPLARSYGIITEKCLFVMCGVQGFNNNQDNYFEGWEPVRQYLVGEAEKVGLTPNKLKEICGVGMWSHWFGKSQFAFITEEHYKELQEYYSNNAFKKEYEEIKKEYEEIKREYYSTRAYFDNTHDKMTEVWQFDRTTGEEKNSAGGHATPKPIALCSRAIKSSSREGEIVLDVFGGSGSTLIACEQLERTCYMMELDPHYCDIIIERWQNLTGEAARKVESYG